MSAANFEAATKHVRTLLNDGPAQLNNDEKLEFYSLFKQATEGDVKGTLPGASDIESHAKWGSWSSRKGMSAEDAKAAYVKRLVEVTKEKGHPWTPA